MAHKTAWHGGDDIIVKHRSWSRCSLADGNSPMTSKLAVLYTAIIQQTDQWPLDDLSPMIIVPISSQSDFISCF